MIIYMEPTIAMIASDPKNADAVKKIIESGTVKELKSGLKYVVIQKK